ALMAERIIIESLRDALAVGSNIIESAEKEVVWLLEPAILDFSFQFSIPTKSKMLIEKGGRVRGITKISETSLNVVRKLVDNGEEIRHVDQYQGAFMLIGDKKESISSINVNVEFSLDDPIVAFWTDDQAYADFLTATFEAAWNEAIDAEKRVQEL
ncbi:MAG: hypothetical protein ACXVIB_06605, partial [Halobacteriota archaeon]